jgi:two-component system alkaline phosphatase synthesis response regulator PhoP
MTPPKILVVDDERNIVDLVSAYLKKEGYQVFEASDGPSALESARANDPDLVILDIMLPGMDGLEVLNQLRRESDVYVILLTARTEEMDRVIGLSVGADDYVTKPFSPRELVARVKAALRRLKAGSPASPYEELVFPHIRINIDSRQVFLNDEPLELTSTEFDLLRNLAENQGKVLSREQLMENVWGYEYFGDTRVVDVHIGHVRQKLGGAFINTVWGVGYRFEDKEG